VPNTALAKEAGLTRWGQGAAYAWDTLGTYWLLVPLLLLGAWLARQLPHLTEGSRARVLLALLPVLAGALHIAYVVKVGGDYMHARLMLAGLFAMLMPVAALPLSPQRTAVPLIAAAVTIWAAVAAIELRTSYAGTNSISGRGFTDEAAYFTHESGDQNPVTFEDYGQSELAKLGAEAKRRAENGEAVLIGPGEGFGDLPSRPGLQQPTVVFFGIIGLVGYGAGTDVRIVDLQSLADPVGSRLRLDQRGRPGHEKFMDYAWAIARFSNSTLPLADVEPGCDDCLQRRLDARDRVAAAREALQCGILHDVLVAVTEPMSVSRFLDNLALAPSATATRFAAQPDAAARELCD
jgi:arabinofuranosyltransferase